MTKVTGELISIDDSAYDGFKGMTIYGKTVQNLWANPSGTSNGVTATANANGSLTLSGTPNVEGSSPTISSDVIYRLKPNTTYIAFSDKAIADEYTGSHGACLYVTQFKADDTYITDKIFAFTGNLSNIFVTDADIGYAKCRMTVRPNTTVSGTYRVMLREATPEEIAKAASTPQTLPVYPDGSGPDASNDELGIMPLASTLADSDFDDYWCPPGLSSIDNVEVVTAGKNLLNYNDTLIKSGYGVKNVDLDGVVTNVDTTSDQRSWVYANSDWKLQLPAGDYKLVFSVLAASNSFASGYQIYDSFDKNILEVNRSFGEVGMISSDFSLSSSTDIGIIIKIYNAKVKVGVFRADDYTGEWEKYAGSTVPIDLQSHSLCSLPDGTRDELHIDAEGNCTLVKRVEISTMPSDVDSWTLLDDAVGDRYRYYLGSSNTAATYTTPDTEMCDRLPIRQDSSNPGSGNHIFASGNFACASVGSNESAQDVVNVCGGGHILYPLATPQTISLGKISLPKLRKKPLVNNVWANGAADGTNFSLAPEVDYEYNAWTTFCDGFKAHGKHSYFDMGCCIAARDTGTPEKKSVTATVPYMSGFYDLSKLYGAIAFEARQLMYRFEFVEDSREELQQKKSQFLEWLSQVHDEEIADDDIPGRHFIGSLSEWEFEEGEEGQSGSLEVTFNCQPFLEADEDTTKTCNAGSNTVTVEGQAVNAYAKTSSGTATIQIGGVTQSVGTTEIRLSVQLQSGDNAVTVTGSSVVLRWKELTV